MKRPPILVYEHGAGGWQLGAIEWVFPSMPAKAPGSGATFTFWHPRLVTLHVWLWYPNPNGLFASTNPRVAAPFKRG